MIKEGFDGLIYNEGGEGTNGENHPSYVFYNLAKVGDQEYLVKLIVLTSQSI